MHRIQAPVTYLQSSYNLPAFTSAQSHLCSTSSASSQHSLFTSYHSCSATCNIILVTYNLLIVAFRRYRIFWAIPFLFCIWFRAVDKAGQPRALWRTLIYRIVSICFKAPCVRNQLPVSLGQQAAVNAVDSLTHLFKSSCAYHIHFRC